MLARLRKLQEEREGGFTLIELLVVMIIIGILAAIAIPTFLQQRDKGYQSAIKNDLKNVSIAEESYATDNNGQYAPESAGISATTPSTDPLVANGAKFSDGVTVYATTFANASGAASGAYCLEGISSSTSAKFWLLGSDNKVVAASPDTTNCPKK